MKFIIELIVIIIIIIVISYYSKKQRKENYVPRSDTLDTNNYLYQEQQLVGKVSDNCYELNEQQCLNCSNCGLCEKGNVRTCIPGDSDGPYFKTGCEKWIYRDFYDGNGFDETQTRKVDSFDKFYFPDYEIRYPMPSSIAGL